jgi:hypothetical protein
MLSLWTLLRSKLAGYLAAIGVAAGILLAAYSKGRTDAGHAQTADRLKASNKARKIENEVDSLGDGTVSDRLNEWMRDRG